MSNHKDYRVAYSDGADHAGIASFERKEDAQAFLHALNATGDYVAYYMDRSRIVRASRRAYVHAVRDHEWNPEYKD